MDRIERREFLTRGLQVAGGVALMAGGGGLLSTMDFFDNPAGAATPGVSTGKPRPGGKLRIGTGADVNSLDATQANWTNTGLIYGNAVLDPLAAQAADGSVQPYLAESITPNTTFTQWRITVRPNITFHDGTALDGAAVVANFQARLKSATGKETLSNVASVAVSDPATCVVTLVDPQSSFDALLTTQTGYIISPATIENGTAAHQLVGTGPFIFQSWEPGVQFSATKNPHYWRSGLPYLDQVTVQPFVDSTSQVDSLLAGQLDVIASADTQSYIQLQKNSSVTLVSDLKATIGEPNVTYVGLNMGIAPTNDLRVRQALAYATDARKILSLVYGGVGTVATGPFFPGSPYYGPTGYPSYNLAKATKLVASYKKQYGSLTVPLITSTDAQPTRLAQVLQSMWEAAGITTTIASYDDATYIVEVFEGKFAACYFQALSASSPDQNYIFWSPTASAPEGSIAINFTRNTDPKVEAALDAARQSGSATVEANAYKAVARQFGTTIPYLWLCRAASFDAATKKVQNFVGSTLPTGKSRYLPVNWLNPAQTWLTA